jgi:twitching motility protein PilT
MAAQEDLLFGKIAVKNKLADEGQVRKCLALLEKSGEDGLGKLLLEQGIISADDYQRIAARVKQVAEKSDKPAEEGSPKEVKAEAKPVSRGPAPSGPGVTVEELAGMDFSHLAGKPIDEYLIEARKVGASDFHFQVDSPPFMRLHGQVVYLKHPVLSPEDTASKIDEIFNDFERETFAEKNDLDFCYVRDHGRYRASALKQRKGMDAIFRIIPAEIPTLAELHLPEILAEFTGYRQGIVLITGPAGSGKTATMTALLDIVNRQQSDHIVTVEDPIEYILPSKKCNVNQRHVEIHTETYASALRSAMRSDPDYICVGEMRDLDTVAMAITAAETGHLVFGTLHTTNATRSVDRIIDVFPPKEQEQIRAMVSESIRGVISQQLLPRQDGLGREPALEIMFATPAVANMIRERKTFQLQSVLQTGAKKGMCTMDDSILELLKKKIISKETAKFFSENKERFD